MPRYLPISTLLPADARWALVNASAIEAPLRRTRAIDEAIAQIKTKHPEFFRIPKQEQQP